MFRFALLLIALLATPAQAACVMGLEGADNTIAQHRLTKHVLEGQRMLALVDILRERVPQYRLEEDTGAVWMLEAPQYGVGFIIEVNEKCVTARPEQVPLAFMRDTLNEVSKRVVESGA